MSHTTTIKELARLSNVSISTVSRALNDHPSIGTSTKERIKRLALELNYEPNIAAIQFKKGRTMTIGVIVPELSETFFSTAVSGIEDIAMENGYNVIIGQSHNDIEKERKIVESFKKNRIDGLLVSLTKSTRSINHFKELERYNIPVVYFDRVPTAKDVHSVSSDLYKASMDIVDFLWTEGHRDIALLKGPNCMTSTTERMRGFMDGLIKRKVKTDASLFGITDLSKESTYHAMKDILSQRNRPTAVIAFNDYVALDAMEYVHEYTSLKINKDIIFVSYANNPVLSYLKNFSPAASVEQFPYRQGQLAMEMFLELKDDSNKSPEPKQIVVDAELIFAGKSKNGSIAMAG
ncbi:MULTISPECIES: LacI family DNA-binding transcriptional regulator [Chitinophagaceae]